jgi:hypothetical protein
VPGGSHRRGGGEDAHGGQRGSRAPAPCPTSAPASTANSRSLRGDSSRLYPGSAFNPRTCARWRSDGTLRGGRGSALSRSRGRSRSSCSAGFLGPGKTTLLNNLLHSSGGSSIGIIVNDFGAIEFDVMAVAGGLGDSSVSPGNGCLRCAPSTQRDGPYLERLARLGAGIVIAIEGQRSRRARGTRAHGAGQRASGDRVRWSRRECRRRRQASRRAPKCPTGVHIGQVGRSVTTFYSRL